MKPRIYKKDSKYYCALKRDRRLMDFGKVGKGSSPKGAFNDWVIRNMHMVNFA